MGLSVGSLLLALLHLGMAALQNLDLWQYRLLVVWLAAFPGKLAGAQRSQHTWKSGRLDQRA